MLPNAAFASRIIARSLSPAPACQHTHSTTISALNKKYPPRKALPVTLIRWSTSSPLATPSLANESPFDESARRSDRDGDATQSKRRRKRYRKKREPQQPPADFSEWTGMRHSRRYRIPRANRLKSIAEAQDSAIEAVLASSVRTHGSIWHATGLVHAIQQQRPPDTPCRLSETVLDEVLVTLVEKTQREAVKQPDIALLSAEGADVTCEALFRCIDIFKARPTIPALNLLLWSAKRDPIVERRSARALSVFRYARAQQLVPTIDFVYNCFCTCVAGLDVEAAAIVMDFALANGIYRNPRKDGCGPSQIDYYNGVMHAALLMGDHPVVETAHAELLRHELKPTDMTDSIFLVLCFERGDERSARIMLSAMQKRGGKLADCVYCAMLRAAGQGGDAEAVKSIFGDFERARGLSRENFGEIVDAEKASYQGVNAVMSDRASAAARGDATFVVFEALRRCGKAEAAVEMLEYLKKEYGFRVPKAVYVLVIETCWRGGRLDLAQKLRRELEGGKWKGRRKNQN